MRKSSEPSEADAMVLGLFVLIGLLISALIEVLHAGFISPAE